MGYVYQLGTGNEKKRDRVFLSGFAGVRGDEMGWDGMQFEQVGFSAGLGRVLLVVLCGCVRV